MKKIISNLYLIQDLKKPFNYTAFIHNFYTFYASFDKLLFKLMYSCQKKKRMLIISPLLKVSEKKIANI